MPASITKKTHTRFSVRLPVNTRTLTANYEEENDSLTLAVDGSDLLNYTYTGEDILFIKDLLTEVIQHRLAIRNVR